MRSTRSEFVIHISGPLYCTVSKKALVLLRTGEGWRFTLPSSFQGVPRFWHISFSKGRKHVSVQVVGMHWQGNERITEAKSYFLKKRKYIQGSIQVNVTCQSIKKQPGECKHKLSATSLPQVRCLLMYWQHLQMIMLFYGGIHALIKL